MTKSFTIRLFIAVIVLIIGVAWVYVNRFSDTVPITAEPIFASQEECEEVTTMECHFSFCDYVPEGQDYSEVCGSVGKQWLPILDEELLEK